MDGGICAAPRRAGLAAFAPEAVRAATDVRALAETIQVRRLPDAEPGTLERLTVRLRDGRQAAISHADIKGEPSLPLTRAERLAKFLACAAFAHRPLDEQAARTVFSEIEHLEAAEDIRPLIRQLSAGAGIPR